ncbi:unnamed protein product [Schistosoma margrebowiei]|uniref:Uncharacterized protein n=1 Tax=Schistosoma margrebowiei TaxID=48269 RepID=A0A183MKU2_9TREM|nr:unnamed protein product [Schistosoma margrebowiei]
MGAFELTVHNFTPIMSRNHPPGIFHLVEPCCWMTYTSHRETQETLQILNDLDLDTERRTDEELYSKFGWDDAYQSGKLTLWQRYKPKIWMLFDECYSSLGAKTMVLYCSNNSYQPDFNVIIHNLDNYSPLAHTILKKSNKLAYSIRKSTRIPFTYLLPTIWI